MIIGLMLALVGIVFIAFALYHLRLNQLEDAKRIARLKALLEEG